MKLAINETTAQKYIQLLTGDMNTKVTFQTFTDDEKLKGNYKGKDPLAKVFHGSLKEHIHSLNQLQNQGAGVFITVNETNLKGRTKKNITSIRAFFTDKDDGIYQGVLPLKPSIVVETKNGAHYYYLLEFRIQDDTENLHKIFKKQQEALINYFSSDKSVKDLPRVLRLPGSYHLKDINSPFAITITQSSDKKYKQNEVKEAFTNNITFNTFCEWVKGLPTESGSSNSYGGRDNTSVIAIKEGLSQGFTENEILNAMEIYSQDSGLQMSVINEKIKRFAKEFNASPWVSKNNDIQTKNKLLDGIDTYITTNKVSYGLDRIYKMKGSDIRYDLLIDKLLIYSRKFKLGGSKQIITSKLNIFQDEQFNIHLDELKNKIVYTDKNDEIDKFAIAVFGIARPLEIAVLKHFIWQVKRKLFKKNVEYHLMPIFVGRTGSGKTRAIENFLSPIEDLALQTDLTTLKDDRFNHNLYERYVLFFDEMAGHGQIDVNIFKNKITSKHISYRLLGTNTTQKLLNNTTFIGASNQTIGEVIKDYTGIRRYFQLTTKDKCDWDEINKLDYHKLWCGVDENSDSPIVEFLDELKSKQEEFRFKESVEEWLIDQELIPVKDSSPFFVPNKTLYNNYTHWCEDSGYKYPLNINSYGRRMKTRLGASSTQAGKRGYYVARDLDHKGNF